MELLFASWKDDKDASGALISLDECKWMMVEVKKEKRDLEGFEDLKLEFFLFLKKLQEV